MNIFVALESRPQSFVAGKMGQHAQLDLRIVGRQQPPIGLAGQKRGANFAAFFGANRNVLQIRIAGAQPARRGDHLIERRMHAAGLRMNQLRQRVDVRAFQLGDIADTR